MAGPPVSTSAAWCVVADLPDRARDGKYDLDLESGGEVEDWIQVASDILFELTMRRWPGPTTVTGYRPPPLDSTDGGEGVSEILLPDPPVVSITEVKIDGAVVAAANYDVFDYARLVWVNTADVTRGAWPSWNDLDEADTEDGTWSVTYVRGTAPPEGGKRACAELATEMAISASPKLPGQSRLPQRVTSITRQGTSAVLLDPLSIFDEGKTGISNVDLWVASVKLGAKRRRGSVHRLGSRRRKGRRAT